MQTRDVMHRNNCLTGTVTLFILLVCSTCPAGPPNTQRASGATGQRPSQQPNPQPRYLKAFVIDDRLSALRRASHLQAEVLRRLRLARPVFIIGTSPARTDQPRFYRVAVTRRTRGWIHAQALAVQGRSGEDQRIMNLIEASADSADKINLCRLIIERFGKSRLVPQAMLLLGGEAERVAQTLSQRTRRRLADVNPRQTAVRDYYLSDAGLDRYSRLGIVFDFNESLAEFIYDGKAYRDIVRRFPKGEEARLARQRLDLANRKTAESR